MMKIKYLLLTIILMFCISILNVNAAEVTISSVNIVDHTGNAIELSTPTVSGLKINFDLAFVDVNDSVKYEVTLNNPTSTEYEISMDNAFNSSEYMEYSYEFKNKTNRIKANSETILYITIKYNSPVPATSLVDGKYVENNTMDLSLLNEDNPNTFGNIIILFIILLGIIGFTFLSIKMKDKNILIIMISLMLVPITVFALEKLMLTVSTKITIEKEAYNIYYSVGNLIKPDQLDSVDYYDGCNPIKLKNNDNTTEDYLKCDNLYVKDTEKHVSGEMVTAKYGPINSLLRMSHCSTEDGVKICPVYDADINRQSGQFTFSCGVDLTNSSYTSTYGKNLLNQCTKEEFYDLIGNVNIIWRGDYGEIDTSSFTFKMPNHDIYIYRYLIHFV